ncbi:hypothetical protein M670_03625 [Schinkia azotoformans MEV2011]|uniref:Uncharacterized protein n=3 Tax=Schinkia azotoformans TaxID=1454 RepID=A0A072NJX5_SCHAZ|nr:hypothetical protein M670_03625 [Schinkia azotoformans MEV2011]
MILDVLLLDNLHFRWKPCLNSIIFSLLLSLNARNKFQENVGFSNFSLQYLHIMAQGLHGMLVAYCGVGEHMWDRVPDPVALSVPDPTAGAIGGQAPLIDIKWYKDVFPVVLCYTIG